MIRLHQFEWSPYCLVTRGILEAARIPHKLVETPLGDRSALWRLTKERYYQVPVLQDGRQVLFETDPDSQVIAKYLDDRFKLGLFPRELEGIQFLVWRYFENEIEDMTFRLNDIHWREFVAASGRCGFVRHKERRFGRGCLEEWKAREPEYLARLENLLQVPEEMLATRPYLLCERPVFSDFCLRGMLANFLYSGHYQLPASRSRVGDWYRRISHVSLPHRA